MKKTSSREIGKMLSKRYTLALTIIALLFLISQGMIQLALLAQQDDSRVVNIAGRQRMLSQRINKTAFGLYMSTEPMDQQRYLQELDTSLALWNRSHNGLQKGDKEMGLPNKNSEKVAAMFKAIEPHYQHMANSAADMIALASVPGYDRNALLPSIRIIQENEADFLKGMDAIVFQYDAESKKKVESIRIIEIILLAVTFLTLSMEVLFIFRPAKRQIEDAVDQIERAQNNLEKLFETAPTAMFLVDAADFRVTRLNHLAQEILCVSPEEFENLDFQNMLECRQGNVCDVMDKLIAGGSIENAEMVLNTPNNLSLIVLLSSNLIQYDDKNTILLGLSDITRLKEAEEVLKRYASIDDMTGLLNKRSGMLILSNVFDRIRSSGGALSVCFMDIDGLKSVNDTLGHEEGDFYIKTIAQVIRGSVNAADPVFRYGGDEIVLILSECNRKGAEIVVDRIMENLRQASDNSGKPYTMHISCGIAVCDEIEQDSPENLLSRADKAMYENKRMYKLMNR